MARSLENPLKIGWTLLPYSKEPGYATYLKRPEDAQTRRDVMGFILKVKQWCNLDDKVTYLAINYIHRVLNKKSFATVEVDPEIIATACVFLAAETLDSVVNLVVAHPEIVATACDSLAPETLDSVVNLVVEDPEEVKNVEVRLKGWLGYSMKSITPFAFLASFVSLSENSTRSTLNARATEILFQVQRENLDFLVYTPSAIAVAALLCAAEELFPQNFPTFSESVYLKLQFRQAQVKKLHPEMKEALERSRRANKKRLIEDNIEDIGTPKKKRVDTDDDVDMQDVIGADADIDMDME